MSKYKFSHITACGSWDHFHLGHNQFLEKAFKLARVVSVGTTSDKMMTGKQLAGAAENFFKRQENVKAFLKKRNYLDRARLFKLDDVYGIATDDKTLEAILVTKQTFAGGQKVNHKRRELGLNDLRLETVGMALAKDGKQISSRRIRKGEIDRQGLVYEQVFETTSLFRLPERLRLKLNKPFGSLFSGSGNEAIEKIRKVIKKINPNFIVCVGDITTQLFMQGKLEADLFIVDLRVERVKKFKSLKEIGFKVNQPYTQVVNKAGTISSELFRKIKSGFDGVITGSSVPVIQVKGEEDLSVIPAILAAPLKTAIFYGQPSEGVVVMQVTEAKKETTYNLLSRFEKEK